MSGVLLLLLLVVLLEYLLDGDHLGHVEHAGDGLEEAVEPEPANGTG